MDSKVPDFVKKLQSMMQKHKGIIHWNSNQTEVVIESVDKMESQVLGSVFRHANFESFVRQLNMYSFKKIVRQNDQKIYFKHEDFYLQNSNNFSCIKRKRKNSWKDLNSNTEEEDKFVKTLPSEIRDIIEMLLRYKAQFLRKAQIGENLLEDVTVDIKDEKLNDCDLGLIDFKSSEAQNYQRFRWIEAAIKAFNAAHDTAESSEHSRKDNETDGLTQGEIEPVGSLSDETPVLSEFTLHHMFNTMVNLEQDFGEPNGDFGMGLDYFEHRLEIL